MKLLSIITVNLNNSQGLKSTLDSLAAQTDFDFEWIIVDGGSTDESITMLQSVKVPFAMKINSELDSGIYDAMNRGVSLSSSEYLVFLNSGDVLLSPDSVVAIKRTLAQRAGADVLLFGFRYLQKTRAPRPLWWRYWSLPTSHQAIIYRRAMLCRVPYDCRYKYAADFENFLNICNSDVKIFSDRTPLIENERYGSDANIDKVKSEYLSILKLYLPRPVAKLLNSVKFYYIKCVI